jgi:predicted Zn-dependent peptidase
VISYEKHRLDNGLTVLTHEAWDTPLASVNLLYNVGSRDEAPGRTGFAHLFEHLMFGGTPQVPDFDGVVSSLGGDNNAFTSCDYTNYYTTVPADALATALALEADRMAHLDISPKALSVQQHVVTEEYNQRYMNQPYGDMWLLMRPLCYKVHPYRWPTIGADIRHVGKATLEAMVEVGATALAIEADKTLLVEHEAVVKLAEEHGIAIVAM